MYFSQNFTKVKQLQQKNQNLQRILSLMEQNPPDTPILAFPLNKSSQKLIPLKFLQYKVEIVGSLAYITLKQEYENLENCEIDVDCFVSFSSESCFYDFEATIGNRMVKGEIKAKEEAKSIFDKFKQKGNLTAFASFCTNLNDIIQINLGNMPPNQKFSIQLSYLQQLEVCMSKFWKLHIPALVSPKFGEKQQIIQNFIKNKNSFLDRCLESEEDLEDFMKYCHQFVKYENESYSWYIKVIITSNSPISFIKSPSHAILSHFMDKEQSICLVELEQKNAKPNKDFVLLFKTNEVSQKSVVLAHDEKNKDFPFCALVSLIPPLNLSDDEVAFNSINSGKTYHNVIFSRMKCEFIFILDRSGSMLGHRIQMAKKALLFFVKSLPSDSFLNVISFGSSYELMFENSEQLSDKITAQIVGFISEMEADLGETEIFEPLKTAFNFKEIKGYYRHIFLLTDGCVSSEEEILDYVKNNNESATLSSIGIGNGSSHLFIKEVAKIGKGKSELIGDSEDMDEKVIGLLKAVMTPLLSGLTLSYDKDCVDMIIPPIENFGYIRINEPINFVVFLKKKFLDCKETKLTLVCENSAEKDKLSETIVCKISDSMVTNDLIHKFGIYLLLKELENKKWMNLEPSISSRMKDLYKQKQKIAIKNQILTKETAFFCILQEKISNSQTKNKKTVIPFYESIDYFLDFKAKPAPFKNLEKFKNSIGKIYYTQKEIERDLFITSLTEQRKTLNIHAIVEKKIKFSYIFRNLAKDERVCVKVDEHTGDITFFKEDQITNSDDTDWNIFQQFSESLCMNCFVLKVLNTFYEGFFFEKGSWIRLEKNCEFTVDEPKMILKLNNKIFEIEDVSFNDLRQTYTKTTNDSDFLHKWSSLEETKSSKKDETFNDQLTKIILAQKNMGYWEIDQNLADLLFLKIEEIIEKCPKEIKEKKSWMTMIVLYYLKLNFLHQFGSWELISQKAEEFLNEDGLKVLEHEHQIKELFNNKSLL